ncbi:MAG TPA: hypothetical protein VEB68_03555 [Croceibacterium sp.]|nr:hypothetical protein [Croceibacterium sp.]
MLEKDIQLRETTITDTGVVQVLYDQVITEGGAEISRAPHRKSFMPGDDVSEEPGQVRVLCEAAWTPDVVAAHRARLELAAR